MTVLLGAQPVRKTVRRKVHIIVRDDGVLPDIPLEPAALDKALGQVSLLAHLIGIDGLAICHVHAVVVENLARLEIALGHGADFDHRPSQRLGHRIAEQHHPRDRVRHLEVDQMVGDEERVERPLSHLVQVQVVLLLGIGVLGQAIDLRQRRADHVIDDPAESAQFLDVVDASDLHDVVAVLEAPGHPSRLHHETRSRSPRWSARS